jgi:molybdopterin molybdotransferase
MPDDHGGHDGGSGDDGSGPSDGDHGGGPGGHDHDHGGGGSGFREVIELAVARERFREAVAPTGTERLRTRDADGRVLAESVDAARPVPAYDRAAMDGFALRAADVAGASDRAPVSLSIVDPPVGPGEAARVHTGSELPAGADAVVRVERTTVEDGAVRVETTAAPGGDVAPAGEDVAEGRRLGDAGERLDPATAALAESAGVRAVAVRRRPTVAVRPTGEEVVERDPEPGEVVETNGGMVANLVRRWGGDPRPGGIVDDDRAALREAVAGATDADLVVTTGGSSVGERDLVPEVLAELGESLFHGVALRPGHPVAGAVVDGTPVLALPGYPVSAYVCAAALLRPAVAWTAGADPVAPWTRTGELGERIPSEAGTRTFARVWVDGSREDDQDGDGDGGAGRDGTPDGESGGDGGGVRIGPVHAAGAGALSTVADADGWVVVPEPVETLEPGTTATVRSWVGPVGGGRGGSGGRDRDGHGRE